MHSISDISKHQRLKDNNEESISPKEMLAELSSDNQALTRYFRSAHETCEKYNDVATASLIEVWIDQAERVLGFFRRLSLDSDSKTRCFQAVSRAVMDRFRVVVI